MQTVWRYFLIALFMFGVGMHTTYAADDEDSGEKAEQKADDEGDEEADEEEEPEKEKVDYVSLGVNFITNVKSKKKKFIKFKLEVLTLDEETYQAVLSNAPLLRNEVFMVLSSKRYSQLNSRKGKKMLELLMAKRFRIVLEKYELANNIKAIVFPEYILD